MKATNTVCLSGCRFVIIGKDVSVFNLQNYCLKKLSKSPAGQLNVCTPNRVFVSTALLRKNHHFSGFFAVSARLAADALCSAALTGLCLWPMECAYEYCCQHAPSRVDR